MTKAQGQGKKSAQPAETYVGLIVKYRPALSANSLTSEAAMQAFSSRAGVKFAAARPAAMGTVVYRFSQRTAPADARAAAARISLDPSVEYAVPDQLMRESQVAPTDPLYTTSQWHLQAATAVVGGANLPLAWQRSTGSNAVVVAIVDSGIRSGHPDLAGRVLPGYDFVSGDVGVAVGIPLNWFSADGNGRDSDPTDPGSYIDATLLNQLPPGSGFTTQPSSWHGTHVAGTIGAVSNNALGVTGVDWSARLLPVRALGRGGVGSTSDIIDGIAWAAGLPVPGTPVNATPARVINLSLGAAGPCDAAYQAVINNVRAAGAIVIVATGNEETVVSKPANCPGAVAVTAHARDGDNAFYANVGPEVTLSAPGGGCGFNSYLPGQPCAGPSDQVTSTLNLGMTTPAGEGYGIKQGTSMATPHVSGVVALMLSLSPTLSASEVRSVLQTTARPHPPGSYCATGGVGLCGSGLLDAAAALTHVANNLPTVTATVDRAVVRPLGAFSLTGSSTPSGGRQTAPGGTSWRQTSGATVPLPVPTSSTVNLVAPGNAPGQLGFLFTATDTAGYSASASVVVTVNSPPAMVAAGPVQLTAGTAGNGSVSATDADGDAITYVLTDGPTGLTMNAATGQWTWTPTAAGAYSLTVMPVDILGNGIAQTYSLNVAAAALPPPAVGSANAPSGGGGGWVSFWAVPLLLISTLLRRRAGRKT